MYNIFKIFTEKTKNLYTINPSIEKNNTNQKKPEQNIIKKLEIILKIYLTNRHILTITTIYNNQDNTVPSKGFYFVHSDFFKWYYGRPQSDHFIFISDNNTKLYELKRSKIDFIEMEKNEI